MRLYFVSLAGLAAILGLPRTCASWYVYSESSTDTQGDPGNGESLFKFYETVPGCNTIELVSFLDVEDVNEIPATSARCDDCSSPLGETAGVPIDEFEWFDKGGSFGHHTYYLNRGGIFVDVDNNRKGTCVQDNSHYLNCIDALVFSRKGIRQLICNWDAPTTPDPEPTPQPEGRIKVMVAGDSISHGMEDDFTWRWRLAAWMTAQGHNVDFVGPYSATNGPTSAADTRPGLPLFPGETAPEPKSIIGLYASAVPSSFTPSGHASWWGRQAVQTRATIQDWVATYQPDYVLLLLGFNDLGWLGISPGGLVGVMGDLVGNARQGKSDVKILLGNVVRRTYVRQDLDANTIAYNKLLLDTYPGWFRYESPIKYVDVAGNYKCGPDGCPDGYDGLHPNSMGEYHIAQAFAGVLKESFGITGADFSVPANPEPRTVTAPSTIASVAVPEGIFTTWPMVTNARGYRLRSRLKGMTDWWTDGFVSTFAAYSPWVVDGQTWEYQVCTKGDNDDYSDWSSLTSVTAHPQTAPGPSNIIVTPSGSGIQIAWDAVLGFSVNRYMAIVWDQDTPGAWIGAYPEAGTTHLVSDLIIGHRYKVWVSTWVNLSDGFPGEGVPAGAREVVVGGGRPAPPTNLQVVNLDPTTIQLTWQGSGSATGYGIYTRSVKSSDPSKLQGTTTETSQGVAFLYPGTWNYEFCISAYNGNLESDHTTCVIPPVYPGFRKRDEIPGTYVGNFTGNSGTPENSTINMMQDKQLQTLYQLIKHNNTVIYHNGSASGPSL